MDVNAIVYLTAAAASVYEGKLIAGTDPLHAYDVMIQRIEAQYIVVRVLRDPDKSGYNVLYLPWAQVIALEMAEGLSHHLIRQL